MKSVLIPLFLLLSLSACSTGSADPSTSPPTPKEQPAPATHACPMHPEVTGQAGDDCSKCGMKLTPLVPPATPPAEDPPKEDEHKDHAH